MSVTESAKNYLNSLVSIKTEFITCGPGCKVCVKHVRMSTCTDFMMESTADDYTLALQLQEEEFDKENSIDVGDLSDYQLHSVNRSGLKNVSNSVSSASSGHSSTVIDNSWELIDPNPDARQLFVEFNQKYFWDKLNGVEVRWSKRMTL